MRAVAVRIPLCVVALAGLACSVPMSAWAQTLGQAAAAAANTNANANDDGMERARRAAESPFKSILEASKSRVAAAPASPARTAAQRAAPKPARANPGAAGATPVAKAAEREPGITEQVQSLTPATPGVAASKSSTLTAALPAAQSAAGVAPAMATKGAPAAGGASLPNLDIVPAPAPAPVSAAASQSSGRSPAKLL